MPRGSLNPKELAFYMSLAHVGLEMVVPMGLGLVIDHYFGILPWATVTGFVLGFVGGLFHLVVLVQRHEESNPPGPPGESA